MAQGVLGNLPDKDKKDFKCLSLALTERFSLESQTEVYRAQLKEREWKHGNYVAEFAQSILRCTTISYQWADTALVDSLTIGYFVDSISDAEIRLRSNRQDQKT